MEVEHGVRTDGIEQGELKFGEFEEVRHYATLSFFVDTKREELFEMIVAQILACVIG